MTTLEFRTQGLEALSTVIKQEKNRTIIEKNIFALAEKKAINDLKRTYIKIISESISVYTKHKSLKDLLSRIKSDRLGWSSDMYRVYEEKQQERDGFLEHPFEVEEGVITCACGSNRTYSYSVQNRSGDEATSVHASCAECGNKWWAN